MKDVTKSNSLCLHKVGSLEAIKNVLNLYIYLFAILLRKVLEGA